MTGSSWLFSSFRITLPLPSETHSLAILLFNFLYFLYHRKLSVLPVHLFIFLLISPHRPPLGYRSPEAKAVVGKLWPTSQIWNAACFCVAHKLGINFTLSNGLKQKENIFCSVWKLYEIQILVSINKVLLEHSDAHLFIYCLWLLSSYSSAGEYVAQTICGAWVTWLSFWQGTNHSDMIITGQHFKCHKYCATVL